MPGPYIYIIGKLLNPIVTKLLNLQKFGKTLDSLQNGDIINLALGDKEC